MVAAVTAVLATACTRAALPVEILPIEGPSVSAVAVDGHGVIYGQRSYNQVVSELFVWDGTTVKVLETFGLHQGGGISAVNDEGVAVGSTSAYGSGGPFYSFPRRWTATGPQQLAPAAEGYATGGAGDIDAAGAVVGTLTGPAGTRGVLWPASGPPVLLPVPAGFDASQAWGMNEHGDIVGSGSGAGRTAAVRWSGPDHAVTVLADPALSGLPAVSASDVGDDGTVIGSAAAADGSTRRSVVWPAGGGRPVALPGPGYTVAADLDAAGTIVGSVTDEHGRRAVRWDGPRHTITFLGEADRSPSAATAISRRGEIVGWASVDGASRAARFAGPRP